MTSSINDLPTELLVLIFSFYIKSEGHRKFLKNIPKVCRRWRDIHSVPSLWRDVISIHARWSWDELNKLGQRGLLSSTRILKLNPEKNFHSESEMHEMINHCPKLRRLIVHRMSRNSMDILGKQCPDIKSLTFGPTYQYLEDVLCPFLRVRGKNITHLKLSGRTKNIVSEIAKYCPSLKVFKITNSCRFFPPIQFPIDELAIGCPELQELKMCRCTVVSSKVRDHNGFEKMVKFCASYSNLYALDLLSTLKGSKKLENLEFEYCRDFDWSSISRIPSYGVKVLNISQYISHENAHDVELAVSKWRRSLTQIRLLLSGNNATQILEAYLRGNPHPKLEVLELIYFQPVNTDLLNTLISACEKLVRVNVPNKIQLTSRVEVEKYLSEISQSVS